MTGLRVAHWHNRYRTHAVPDAARLAAWDAALAEVDVDAELNGRLDADEWLFVRRLSLALRLPWDGAAADARAAWQDGLQQALTRALDLARAGGAPDDLLHFEHRRALLADMLYRVACGDLARAWAWRRARLMSGSGRAAALAGAVAALLAEPEHIWPVLARMLLAERATGAWSAVLAALERDDCTALMAACPQAAGLRREGPRRAAAAVPTPEAAAAPALAPATPAGQALASWIAAHGVQAARRADMVAALYLCAEAPGAAAAHQEVLHAAVGAAIAGAAAAQVAGATRRTHEAATPAAGRGAAPPAQGTARPGAQGAAGAEHLAPAPAQHPSRRLPRAELDPAPLPCADELRASDWGGLLFLTHVLPVGDLLDAVAALPDAPGHALARCLWQIGLDCGVTPGDAALSAFCGGWQPAAGDFDAAGALILPASLRLAARACVAALEPRLADRLPQWAAPRLARLMRRPARIRLEPGWIEVHFALDQADPAVRRAALDLDPGWLPWLGCVLRFRYV